MWYFLSEEKTGVVPCTCKECMWENKEDTEGQSEHRQAARRGDQMNGFAVQVQKTKHWKSNKVQTRTAGYWQRKAVEAIQMRSTTLIR